MKRQVIRIDEDKCNGCGACIPGCPEGALQIIDGKARLVSDLLCDGLGACIGECPRDAISVVEREARPYNEREVMEHIVQKGENTIRAHLQHLRAHGQDEYVNEAIGYLREHGIEVPDEPAPASSSSTAEPCNTGGCPGSRTRTFSSAPAASPGGDTHETGAYNSPPRAPSSALTHWPVQLHLLSPRAPHYRNADLVLAADCVAYALPTFHERFLAGKKLAIACPKLDTGQDVYLEKLTALIDDAHIDTLTVMIMQVPCCNGLLSLAQQAAAQAQRKVPIKNIVVSPEGEIIRDEWL